MDRPDLYICHTAYHLLIAIVRALRAGGGQAVWLSEQIPNAEVLAGSHRLDGIFSQVRVLHESRWPGVVTGPLAHHRNRRAFEKAVGVALDRSAYRNVYLCNDWSAAGRYLQDCRAPYILCEDTVGGTLDPDQHLVDQQRAAPDFAARKKGRGYLYWGGQPLLHRGGERGCRPVHAVFAGKAGDLFEKSAAGKPDPGREKCGAGGVFLTWPLPDDPAALADATLLLTRSFVADGLMDQATQDAMFRAVAAKYADGPLYIKTHPRDTTDYAKLFPGAVILERTMPSEVLNFCLPGKFRRAVTVQSWVLRGFTAAEENIFLTLEEAKQLMEA